MCVVITVVIRSYDDIDDNDDDAMMSRQRRGWSMMRLGRGLQMLRLGKRTTTPALGLHSSNHREPPTPEQVSVIFLFI